MEEQKKYIRKYLICKREAMKKHMNPSGTNQPICSRCKMLLLLCENGNKEKYYCHFCNREIERGICEFRKIYPKDIEKLASILKNKGIS